MNINETKPGSSVELTINYMGKMRIIRAKALKAHTNFVIIPAVYIDGKLLNAKPEMIKCDVKVTFKDDVPYKYTDVQIKIAKSGETYYHIISCDAPGKAVNRRETFRVGLMYPGIVTFPGVEPFEVTMNDISVSGFSFIVDSRFNKFNILPDTELELSFSDTKIGGNFELMGQIVRVVENGPNRLVGCRLNYCNHPLDPYVAKRQRLALSRQA